MHQLLDRTSRRALAAAFFCLTAAAPAAAQPPAYKNESLSFEARAADLVSRMTLEEKANQMKDNAPAIERLGVPAYGWWNEALHGVARSGLATVFPQAIGFAATWDDSLVFRMATVISDEARAKHEEYVRHDQRERYQGLTIWSPNINIFRDPRWGRGQETYGEDPFLTGHIAAQFIRGLQGDDPKYYKTISTVKHFAVHSGPEPERHAFDAVVSERDLRETYLPQFETAIKEGKPYSLMCAYNRLDGEAACGSDRLIGILRHDWNFPGYIVSDCGALDDMYQGHKVVATASEAAALGVKHETDLDCGGRVYSRLVEAVRKGQASEQEIDASVRRLFVARMKLGMFDAPEHVRWAQIPFSVLDQPAHRALARQVARESIVLLKNDHHTLPLRKDLRTIAVIGPNANQWRMLLGNYNGIPKAPVTPLRGVSDAVKANGGRVLYALGSDLAEGFPVLSTAPSTVLRSPDGQPGLLAEYFASKALSGGAVYTATDSVVEADWAESAPRADMNGNDFAVRWSGTFTPRSTGAYRLGVIGTMKFQLFLDDSVVARSVYPQRDDEFPDPRLSQTDPAKPLQLEGGRAYRLRLDAAESYGEAQAQLVWAPPSGPLEDAAVASAQQADAVVLFLGLTANLEGEEMRVQIPGFRGGDRTSIDLPAPQQQLLEKVVAVGKPTVLVLLNGSALAVNWAQEHVPAIVEAWYPGQAGGTAIADVLFGDYNPAGRLPVSFYKSVRDLPSFDDYAMKGRTYRYFTGTTLYPFGHGLSYTTFTYRNLRTSTERVTASGTLDVSIDVTNSGSLAGDEVVQLYVAHPASKVPRAIKDLRGYRRLSLKPGETRTARFAVPVSSLAYWDERTHGWIVESAPVKLQAGASSADIRAEHTIQVIGGGVTR